MTSLDIEYPHDDLPRGRFSLEARVAVIALLISIVGAVLTTAFSAGTVKGELNTHASQISDLKTAQADDKARRDKTDDLILEELRAIARERH